MFFEYIKNKLNKMTLKFKISLAFFLFSVFICILLSVLSQKVLSIKLLQSIKERAKIIAYLTSTSIDKDLYKNLILKMRDNLTKDEVKKIEYSEEFLSISKFFNEIRRKNNNFIYYIYTLCASPKKNVLRFVVDADVIEGNSIEKQTGIINESISHFGKEFNIENFPAMQKAFNEQIEIVEENFSYDNEYNLNCLSAYSPIYDKNNIFLGIIGIDISDSYYKATLLENIYNSIIISGIIIILSFIVSLIIGNLFTKRIIMLNNIVERFAKKDFNIRAPVTSNDEIGKLSNSFNHMAETIKEYSTNLNELVEKRTELLNKIIYTVGAIIIVLETGGKIMKFNRKCEEITGFKEEDVIGKSIWDFLSPNKENEMNDVFEILLNTILTSSFESPLVTRDGRELYVLWNNTAIKDNEDRIIWTIGTGIDITERIKAEAEIKKLNEDLEKRVIERTQQLAQANKELEQALETLKNTQAQLIQAEKMASLGSLVAGVAHEINTPVGIGITAITFLEQKTKEIIELYKNNKMKKSDLDKFLEIVSDSVPMIHANLNRAAELIVSFKKVAVDQSNEEKRKFKIKEYTEEILISLKPKLKKTKILVEIECAEDFEIDNYPGSFSQIITNLVMNSLIHAFDPDSEGKITIKIEKAEKNVIITFSDNGKGIPENFRDKIFEPFFTTKRGQGGTGLGLHIIFNIVTQRFNGTIKCESEVGKGTSFIISFPIKSEE